MAHAASAAGAASGVQPASAAASSASSAAATTSLAGDDGMEWVPVGEGLPGVYTLDRSKAAGVSSGGVPGGMSAGTGLAPLIDTTAFRLHEQARTGDLGGFQALVKALVGAEFDADITDGPSEAAIASKLLGQADNDGRTPLHYASASGHLDLVTWLLKQPGVTPSTVDASGWTPLHSATSAGHVEVMKRLIAAGANADVATAQGRTPLHYSKGRAIVVETLLLAARAIDAADTNGNTPLMRCAALGAVEAATLLLEAGCDVEVKDKEGYTALHHAAESGSVGVCKVLLIDGHANFKATTRDDKTAGDLVPKDQLHALADIVREVIAGSTAAATA